MKIQSFAFSILLALIYATALMIATQPARAADGDVLFASVDDIEITREEFEREVYSAARQTFYHARPPGGEEFIQFRKDVADRMIDRELLLREANRRDLRPDNDSIDAKIAVYESRYGDTERWQTEGPQLVAQLRTRFEEESVLDTLESDIHTVSPPGDAEARAFFDENPELFTEPAQNRVSIILLGVAPSATAPDWQAARDEAQRLLERLQDGMPFEELARLHSADASAAAGGDMGYLHVGMLNPGAEEAIGTLEIGNVSNPVQVLEGMAIFKLTERRTKTLRDYGDVRQRAEELWIRDTGEQRWKALLAELRSASEVSVDAEYLVSLPDYAQQ